MLITFQAGIGLDGAPITPDRVRQCVKAFSEAESARYAESKLQPTYNAFHLKRYVPVLLNAIPIMSVPNTPSNIKNCWLDCDPGHDDAIALLLALFLKESVNLIGVSTVGTPSEDGLIWWSVYHSP